MRDPYDMIGKTLLSAAGSEPVTVDECKAYARFTSTAEDALITDFITAARELAEIHTGRRLISQQWKFRYNGFPSYDFIEIPSAPVSSVDEVKYLDAAGVEQTLSTSVYVADLDVDPGRIYLAHNASWPTVQDEIHNVRVTATVGYADASAVPAAIKTAIKIAVAEWIYDREGSCAGLPDSAIAILNRYRFWFNQ